MADNPLRQLRELLRRLWSCGLSARWGRKPGLRPFSSGEYREALTRRQEAHAGGGSACPTHPQNVPTVPEPIRGTEGAGATLTATARSAAAVTAAPLPSVPGYELLEVLGSGGMGVVYKARQLGFKRVVALKMIRAGAAAAPAELARFRTEAEAVARLRHPNIVQVHDIGEAGGCPYYSMEHMPGGSLARRAKAEPLAPRRAAEVVEALARAMQHAHQAGVVHRDLKPSNVLLDADGTPKVADFGLAKLLDAGATNTTSDAVLGTACYMAPEQAVGGSRNVGPVTDVYGLGAILYDLLTGRPPVERGSWAAMVQRVLRQDPPDPRRLRPEVDRDLEAVCLKCLRKQPGRRYASARELADDLRRWLDGRPTAARPLGWAGRLGRRARHHPRASAAVLLLLAAAAATPVVTHYLDPERVPKDRLARLEHGEAVTLIGPSGPPAWSRNLIGQAAVRESPEADGVFTIGSLTTACLELLPAGPARGYRFRAEVRHLSGNRTGKVGLYFAHSAFATPNGTEHCFCAFTFDDRQAYRRLRDGTWQNNAPLELWRRFPNGSTSRPGGGVIKRFRPAVDEEPAARPWRPWRALEVVVTNEYVRVYWDGEFVGQADRSSLVERFQALANRPADAARHEPGVTPSFGPGGGLGVLVDNGLVSFRNASVSPVDEPNPGE
jgi:serine/threonine-protein kinase